MVDNDSRIRRTIQNKTYEWNIPKGYTESRSDMFFFWSPISKQIGPLNDEYWQKRRNAARKCGKETFRCLRFL